MADTGVHGDAVGPQHGEAEGSSPRAVQAVARTADQHRAYASLPQHASAEQHHHSQNTPRAPDEPQVTASAPPAPSNPQKPARPQRASAPAVSDDAVAHAQQSPKQPGAATGAGKTHDSEMEKFRQYVEKLGGSAEGWDVQARRLDMLLTACLRVVHADET